MKPPTKLKNESVMSTFIPKKHNLKQSSLYRLKSINQIAKLLGFSLNELKELTQEKGAFYRCSKMTKRNVFPPEKEGGALFYKLYNKDVYYPTEQLKNIHQRLALLLSRIEKPDYLFSGVKGKSYLKNAEYHLNSNMLLRIDIHSFYHFISERHIFKFFRNDLMCSERVAHFLADLCSYHDGLAIGSPLSIQLAFFVNQDLFNLINELSKDKGLRMSVYVDDICFSGNKITSYFQYQVIGLLHRFGYQQNRKKCHLYKGKNQIKFITGMIIKGNQLDIPNEKYWQLHQKLEQWKTLINSNNVDSFALSHLYHSLMGLLSHFAQIKSDYEIVKKKVKREYLKQKEKFYLAIFNEQFQIFNKLVNQESNLTKVAQQRILLKRTINQLAKANKKYLFLFKELEVQWDKYLRNTK